MKVLHFFKTYWPDTFGGVERTIHAIATGTMNYGVESDVLSLSSAPDKNSVEFDGHMAHKAKLDFEFASTGFSRDVFGRFKALSAQADLIHYHFPWPLMDIVQLAFHPSKPTLVTYHSDIVKQKLLLQFYKPVMHRFLSSVDRIVATSPNYVRTSKDLRLYENKTSVIPLGLDATDYPQSPPEEKAKWRALFPAPFFLFVGVLRYYKGIHILLDAAAVVDRHIVIVGQGPMESELKVRAKALGLTNVHFVGAVSDSAKTALLELCTALVFPSHLRSEAFGLSLVEAARAGKPMISCEIGTGTSFVNVDGETGLVVTPDNPPALANAIMTLAQDTELAARFGQAAQKRFAALFTADRMAQSYARLYREMQA